MASTKAGQVQVEEFELEGGEERFGHGIVPERRQQCLSTRRARLPVAVARTPLEPELLAGSAIPNKAFGYSRFVPIMHSDATSYRCDTID